MVLSTVHEETAVWQIEGNLEGESLSVSYVHDYSSTGEPT